MLSSISWYSAVGVSATFGSSILALMSLNVLFSLGGQQEQQLLSKWPWTLLHGSTRLKRRRARTLKRQAMGQPRKIAHEELIPLELSIFPMVSLNAGLVLDKTT